MIDIHTHILPGLDDGAAHFDDTLDMARAACSEGIAAVIATPHHANGVYTNPAADVRLLADAVNVRLREEGIPLTVAAGQEIRVHDDLLDAWQRGELLPLAGSHYVLLEMPSSRIPRSMEEMIHELSVMGLTPIIAHPERNAEIVRHPERLSALTAMGACAQVTSHSLLGAFGKRIEQSAWTLLRQGDIHIVSSDAHHVTRRGFRLGEAYASIERTLGEQWVIWLKENAGKVPTGDQFGERPEVVSFGGGAVRKILSFFIKK